MSILLQFKGISKAYGLKKLFEEATVSVAEGQKIGLIGANGSGKTTLLKILMGLERLDSGTVSVHSGTRLGYLEQNEVFPPGETAIAYLMRASGRENWECAKMAAAFEIKNEMLEKKFSEFSGGYQMRLRLTAMLVRDPNLLLLDEPTNYLDLQTVLLLEQVLRKFKGAMLLVSHDREFLKNVCTHTLEIAEHKLTLYPGDIEAYFEYKEQKMVEAMRYNKKVRRQQQHLQEFVDRYRAGTRASQAQSKLKQLEKLKTIEIAHSIRTVRMRIVAPPQKKALALQCRDLSVGYEAGHPVLSHIDFELDRGEHLAVVGENGQGKSTFLKTIAGELPAITGSFKWGHNLKIAYYAQQVAAMLPEFGLAGDYLKNAAGNQLPEDLLRMAGNFLFTEDDLKKPISVLSGGERARLCLAGIFLGKHDVLIMDEPTNHLDFDTVEALGEALGEYGGTVIFVSHSRTFVSQLATSILEIRDGRAVRYPYPYEIYVHELKTHEKIKLEEDAPPYVEGDLPYVRSRIDIHDDIRREKQALKRLEEKMHKLGIEKDKIQQWFIANAFKPDVAKTRRHKEIEDEILSCENDWFGAEQKLEALNEELKTGKNGY